MPRFKTAGAMITNQLSAPKARRSRIFLGIIRAIVLITGGFFLAAIFTPTILILDIVELGRGNAIVHGDGREKQLTRLGHVLQTMDTSGRV